MTSSYKVETMSDITKLINKENKKRFLEDFNKWLDNTIEIKETVDIASKELGLKKPIIECEGFTWIDDGKKNETINIKIEEMKTK